MGREPRFACKAVYYNLYINEFFYRVNPCCYMVNVPGYDEVRARYWEEVDYLDFQLGRMFEALEATGCLPRCSRREFKVFLRPKLDFDELDFFLNKSIF